MDKKEKGLRQWTTFFKRGFMKYRLQIFLMGMAIFSMFFGGGNLTFPLWVGSETTSIPLAALGFILSGVLLPFYGIVITLYFKGNYEECFEVFGKNFGKLLAFLLLLFWIPLGSGPRCNQLAFGAFCCQFGTGLPLWAYSALYSVLLYVLTLRKNRILDILGTCITPLLILALLFLIFSVFKSATSLPLGSGDSSIATFYSSFAAGYNTMDFIAAIFFASTIIGLMREKQKEKFNFRFVRSSCLVAIFLLSAVYIGMISVGCTHREILSQVSKDQLLASLGHVLFDYKFQIVVFLIITLSVLSTSMALVLVFSEYLRKTIFKEKLTHSVTLFLSVLVSFLMSILGFERLQHLISYGMSTLYPVLLVVTTCAFYRRYLHHSTAITKR
jgi:LIVCS family branched-chain amino acid:cation transporter